MAQGLQTLQLSQSIISSACWTDRGSCLGSLLRKFKLPRFSTTRDELHVLSYFASRFISHVQKNFCLFLTNENDFKASMSITCNAVLNYSLLKG